MSDVTAIPLFAGAGGWDLGFAACGVPILAALDHNERSLATHALNFPETEHIKTDITQETPPPIPSCDNPAGFARVPLSIRLSRRQAAGAKTARMKQLWLFPDSGREEHARVS
jgi:hypothetical protein